MIESLKKLFKFETAEQLKRLENWLLFETLEFLDLSTLTLLLKWALALHSQRKIFQKIFQQLISVFQPGQLKSAENLFQLDVNSCHKS